MKIVQGFLLLSTVLGAPLEAAGAATIYTNNFSGGLGGFTTTGGLRTDNGETYLGNLTQGATASVTISTIGYQNVTLSFDLYGVLSLDGNGPAGGGADPFLVADDSGTIFNYTFANYTGPNTQSYGGVGNPAGSYAARTGAAGCGALGFGCGDFGDASYSFSGLTLTPSANSLTLTFTGNSNQSVGDEFYGIDNIVVTGTPSAVPEPTSWALLIAGFGLVGVGARRQRASRLA